LKNIIKTILIIAGIILTVAVLYFSSLLYQHKKYEERVRKIAHVSIYKKEQISELKQIELRICDSIYRYDILDLNDTISENIGISDRIFPCKVSMIYEFNNGVKEKYEIDDFNCSGCSGTNFFVLKHNGIEYLYTP